MDPQVYGWEVAELDADCLPLLDTDDDETAAIIAEFRELREAA